MLRVLDEPVLYYSLVMDEGGLLEKNRYPIWGISIEDCASACRSQGFCRAFNYSANKTVCVICTEDGPLQAAQGWKGYALL